MRKIRYRTEAFSGSGERDAAEVMAYETFELGNTDILECLCQGILKDNDISGKMRSFIRELDDNGFVDDLFEEDKVEFYREVLGEIEKETGISVKYALWLADKETVTNKKWYGRDMIDDRDFDGYEVGPVILSDLGFDGTLYGYAEEPVCFGACDVYYHVTLMENIRSIYEKGLIPQIGERSADLGEKEEAIFLFPSKEDMDTALQSWLGEWYEENYGEDCSLALLQICLPLDIPVIDKGVGFERVCFEKIPSEYITFYDEMENELDISRMSNTDELTMGEVRKKGLDEAIGEAREAGLRSDELLRQRDEFALRM